MMLFPDSYIIRANAEYCRVCGNEEDLRFGCCFDCSDYVAGKQITSRLHRLWDKRDPSNFWYFGEPEQDK